MGCAVTSPPKIKMKLNFLNLVQEDCVKCFYLHVFCSIVKANVADSHRPRGYYGESGPRASGLSEALQQGVAPEDCLTGAGI